MIIYIYTHIISYLYEIRPASISKPKHLGIFQRSTWHLERKESVSSESAKVQWEQHVHYTELVANALILGVGRKQLMAKNSGNYIHLISCDFCACCIPMMYNLHTIHLQRKSSNA